MAGITLIRKGCGCRFEKYKPIELAKTDHADALRSRPAPDKRLEARAAVMGVFYQGKSKAYPIAALKKAGGLIRDTVGGEPIVVLWYEPTGTAAVYSPFVEATKDRLSLQVSLSVAQDGSFVDGQLNSRWGIDGRAVDGLLRGRTLRWVDSVQCRWFAWAAEYPKTEIYAPKKTAKTSKTGKTP